MYLIVPGKAKGTLLPESCLFAQNQAWLLFVLLRSFYNHCSFNNLHCVSGMEGWPQDRWEQTQIEEGRPSTGREGEGAAFGPLEISWYYPIRAHCVGILMKSQNKRGRKPCPVVEIQRILGGVRWFHPLLIQKNRMIIFDNSFFH